MPLALGSRIGSHVVVSLIGQGGMGEVYRARGTTLERRGDQRLPDSLAGDPDRLGRFEREAPDRKRFLFLPMAGPQRAPPLEVVVNWPALLRSRQE